MDPFSRVRSYYIQGAPTRVVIDLIKQCPDWSELAFQERIVSECINHPLIQKNGHVQDYECPFVRKYFDMLMLKDVYIADSLALEYDRIHNHAAEEGEYHFCYYPIPERNEALQIRLKRSSNCTAFKTWEACFAFMEWILDHKEAFHGKRVLELGAGSGLCGQMLQCVVQDCKVTMSDYCDEVVEYILGNVEENSTVFQEMGIEPPSVATVDFCNPNEAELARLAPQVIIATDITFSPDLVDGLVAMLDLCFSSHSLETAFICCTIRTEELFNRFKSGMEKKYRIVEHELEQKNIWYYFKYARIVLLEISKSPFPVCFESSCSVIGVS